jgi:hypothetical protein
VALFGTGVISLDSNMWWVAPLLTGALGVTLGAVAPFGQTPAGDADRPVDSEGTGARSSTAPLSW